MPCSYESTAMGNFALLNYSVKPASEKVQQHKVESKALKGALQLLIKYRLVVRVQLSVKPASEKGHKNKVKSKALKGALQLLVKYRLVVRVQLSVKPAREKVQTQQRRRAKKYKNTKSNQRRLKVPCSY